MLIVLLAWMQVIPMGADDVVTLTVYMQYTFASALLTVHEVAAVRLFSARAVRLAMMSFVRRALLLLVLEFNLRTPRGASAMYTMLAMDCVSEFVFFQVRSKFFRS